MSDSEDFSNDDHASSTSTVLGVGEDAVVDETTVQMTGEVRMTHIPLETENVSPDGVPVFNPRAYQLEMLEESMKRNIIVAMDTGSGKTHVYQLSLRLALFCGHHALAKMLVHRRAVMRIQAELDRCSPPKMVWFMAPTLELCSQQFQVLQMHIPGIQMKYLSGNDNVDKWTEAGLWEAFLHGVRVVVSTYQILLDGLTHGFVSIENLALIVFDEAHNCIKRNAGAKVMREFYQPAAAEGRSVPHILGLTASPVMNSRPQSIIEIEETLHAVCRTPHQSHAELLQQVKMPEFSQVLYTENEEWDASYPRSLTSLFKAYQEMNIYNDPYIISLQTDESDKAQRRLEDALQKRKSWCFDQMKAVCQTSLVIFRELGHWAVNFYMQQIVLRAKGLVEDANYTPLDVGQISHLEKIYIFEILSKVDLLDQPSPLVEPLQVSDKFKQFIKAIPRNETFAGIVFVQQRATVAVLAHLLSVHPDSRNSFRVGTMVGTSNNSKKLKNIADCIDIKNQRDTLDHFREGKLDLMIATSVLEEGIDVPACNIVLCFDEPANLKAFVQRRGRARQKDSKLVLMMSCQSDKLREFQELEAEMKAIYADNMRAVKELADMEDAEDHDGRKLRIQRTDALLNLDNAVSHLYHFCSVLSGDRHVDRSPEFIAIPGQPVRVILPKSMDASLREFQGQQHDWVSEKHAKKDAAFEAYVHLYNAGLVNDNLMPLLRYDDTLDGEFTVGIKKRPSHFLTSAQVNPWVDIAQIWAGGTSKGDLRATLWTVTDKFGTILSSMAMILPVDTPELPPLKFYWDASTEILVTSEKLAEMSVGTILENAQEQTWLVLDSVFGYRLPIRGDAQFIALFKPMVGFDNESTFSGAHQTITSPSQLFNRGPLVGLIRYERKPYQFEEWLDRKPSQSTVQHPHYEYSEAPEDAPYLAAKSVTQRTDFLHPIPSSAEPSTKRFSYALPVSKCTVDDVPAQHVKAAMLIPSIMHRVSVYLVAEKLRTTVLSDVGYQDLGLVLTAISSSAAREETNYQRLEFLGDSLLKICTSIQLLADYPTWHEGYLSAKKDRIVANSRLADAALAVGLAQFILTKPFTGRKWKPMYVEDLMSQPLDIQRKLSSKVLADVVEALIGAAMIDGGISKALACMKVFLPEIKWQSLEARRAGVFHRAPGPIPQQDSPETQLMEQLIGYSFEKKSLLLESMTHASCSIGTASLERLEFVGDAILDHLVVQAMYSVTPELPHYQMHLLRTALVNADFLAFICMEWSTEQQTYNIAEDDETRTFQAVESVTRIPLWKFMRHTSATLGRVQLETAERHKGLRGEINAAITRGSHYPWALLSRLRAEKFFSDMVESLLGALYIDSGSFQVCEAVLEQIGVLQYLRRIIKDNVHILHPKEELGIVADTMTVEYKTGLLKRIVDSVETFQYTCQVLVGDETILEIGDGVSKDEVETKAAEAAVVVLRARKKMV